MSRAEKKETTNSEQLTRLSMVIEIVLTLIHSTSHL